MDKTQCTSMQSQVMSKTVIFSPVPPFSPDFKTFFYMRHSQYVYNMHPPNACKSHSSCLR